MPTISLTEFTDYCLKSGPPKLTVVRQAKSRQAAGYDPQKDYWKILREHIRDVHSSGQNRTALPTVLQMLKDPKRQGSYPPLIASYSKFWGKKAVSWFDPPRDVWSHGGLSVRLNPELGLSWAGADRVIKLYFKHAPQLSKRSAGVILELMRIGLSAHHPTAEFCVLDVERGNLYSHVNAASVGILPLLRVEAAGFAAIWPQV